MIGLVLTALLQAAPALANPVVAAPEAAANLPPPAPVTTPSDRLEALEKLYDQTCTQRAYARYDDLCQGLRDQIKAYRSEVARAPKP